MPLFCPTGQIEFVKSKKRNVDKKPATLHGVVFAILFEARLAPAWGLVWDRERRDFHRATDSFSAIALRRIRDSDSTEYGF